MKNIINLASIILLLFFGIVYLLKLYILRSKYNIKGNVLAKKNKGKKIRFVEKWLQITTAIWIFVWIGEIIITLLEIDNRVKLWNIHFLSISGVFVITVGILFFIIAAMMMKASWRVGIDKGTKSELITEGIYKYSRNPAFVGFYLMFLGLFMVYADLVTCFSMLINIYALNGLVIEEEKHLEEMFGKEYTDYKRKTPRYLLW